MGFARWLTPRFPLEMTFASALTLAVVFAFAMPRREAPANPPVSVAAVTPVKAPLNVSGPDPRDRLSRFVEQTALAHVGPLRPEAEIEAADAPSAPAAVVMTNRTLSVQERNRTANARPDATPRGEAAARADAPARADTPLRPELALLPKAPNIPRPPLAIPPHNEEAANLLPEAPRLDGRPKDKAGFHLPAVSDLAAKLPSGRDISDGVSSMGKRIGSIFH